MPKKIEVREILGIWGVQLKKPPCTKFAPVALPRHAASPQLTMYCLGRAIVFVPHGICVIRPLYLFCAVFLYFCYHVVLALCCGRLNGVEDVIEHPWA